MERDRATGSELHRVPVFENYDQKRFNAIYKVVKPYINKLASGIDSSRFRVDKDIIKSYFMDKALYVFMKYQEKYDDEHLRAAILSSLYIFRNKLLRGAYGEQAEFYQTTASFDSLMTKGVEDGGESDENREETDNFDWEDEEDEYSYREDLSNRFNDYLRSKLSEDEYLLFRTELDPPPFLAERKARGRISVLDLIEFFDLPKTNRAANMISEMRKNIKTALELAKTEFKCR